MSVKIQCEFPGCGETKEAESGAVALGLMQLHQANVHPVSQKQKPPKVDRPKICRGASAEEWATFTRRWEMFKAGTVMDTKELSCQLMACCESELEMQLFQNNPKVADASESDILIAIKTLAVVDVAATVRITELLHLRQEHGEGIRAFVARVRGKANICAFSKKCSCNNSVNYTDDIVRWVILAGLSTPEISREVLGTADIDNKTLTDTITIIEAKERAARALSENSSIAGASGYKSQKKAPNEVISCAECSRSAPKYGRNRRGRTVEYTLCSDCFRASRQKQNPRGARPPEANGKASAVEDEPSVYDVLGALNGSTRADNKVAIPNYVFDGTLGWRVGESQKQPTVSLTAEIDHTAYVGINHPVPDMHPKVLECISDTGAQSCLMGLQILWKLGLRKADLVPVRHRMRAANDEDITLIGAIFLNLTGKCDNGDTITAPVMAYVSPSTDRFYISRTALECLRIIPSSFPKVGAAAAIGTSSPSHPVAECGCPVRSEPPGRPPHLPFEPTPQNTDKMQQWLLQRYAGSTFNICPHQALPTMTGPPMAIRVDPDVEPAVTSRPARVPVHWKEQVKEQLQRDVALGVIEKVPPGTPVTWLHNMVITPKANGSPRRTVDLQTLNKVSVRETHHTVPPVQQARAIPRNQVMTVLDAWNGYHSIPILESDRHKTTFITEEGRYRYCRAPMGYLTSGDAYTHRYDRIVADVPRLAKVIDDALLHDDVTDRENHWWRIIDYLELTGSNGVILNPDKLQFAREQVDFTAFNITADEVKPLPKYLQSIEDFPRPANITDVRSWFGLVNQVAHYGQLVDIMAPFKPLLSPKTPFRWSDELEASFQKSKQAIIAAIARGVEIYDPSRKTCLQTDYSTTGVGYWLRQKYCNCVGDSPNCCKDGWRITLAGSRFLKDAEKRYAPIEGECLAVAWALEDTRWFTMGCDDLVVATDHKPLLKILGDKRLDAIENPRLFRLKQRTMMWRFTMVHIPGIANPAADATSRHPATHQEQISDTLAIIRQDQAPDNMEGDMVADIQAGTRRHGVVTWTDVQHATVNDAELQELMATIVSGFPLDRESLPTHAKVYWQWRDRLSVIDGVIMMDSRMVIPKNLRSDILRALHAAHQGVSGMASRAQHTVFWPGLSKDIDDTRKKCAVCATIAPSQARLPPADPTTPAFPFQYIAADYFSVKATKYLVVVDRFSGWPHIMRATKSDEAAGSQGLIRNLKYIFATFGAPEELSSDGGPEFAAADTQDFLQRWGVAHRLSSAYNPQSNGRAEVAVKSMKRLLQCNTSASGKLDDDNVVAGLLQYRNTPEPTTKMSPALILFGRPLRDRIPIPPGTAIHSSPLIAPVWKDTWRAREEALRLRFGKQMDSRQPHTRNLPQLLPQAKVQLQNLCGPHATKWDRTGQVVQRLPHDQYLVRVDGSGRIARRNRRHIRHVTAMPPALGPLLPAVAVRQDMPQGPPTAQNTDSSEPVDGTLTPAGLDEKQSINMPSDTQSLPDTPTPPENTLPNVGVDPVMQSVPPTDATGDTTVTMTPTRPQRARHPPGFYTGQCAVRQ